MNTTKKTPRKAKRSGPRAPQLKVHRTKSGEYGRAWFDGAERRYGRIDDPATAARFAEDLARWLANGRKFPEDEIEIGIEVRRLVALYLKQLEEKKGAAWIAKKDGAGNRIAYALDALVECYGSEPAAEFSPRKLKGVRQSMIHGPWAAVWSGTDRSEEWSATRNKD